MKKSKFNWGHGIFVFYLVFVGVLLTALIASFGVDHALVVDDYYAQDLDYQNKYEQSQNAIASDALRITHTNDQSITINIEASNTVYGIAYLYRASDKSADFEVPLTGTTTRINSEKMLKGKWTIKVEWKVGGRSYYAEKPLYVA